MTFRLLDLVALDRDLPEHRLRRGQLGTIVELYGSEGAEVEFLGAGGATIAVVTLSTADLKPPPPETGAARSAARVGGA